MKRVTNTTFNILADNRRKANKVSRMVKIQCMKKDGTWGKAVEYTRYGNETDEQVVERLIKNNGKAFRLAQ